jgi:hypothetical protein
MKERKPADLGFDRIFQELFADFFHPFDEDCGCKLCVREHQRRRDNISLYLAGYGPRS